MATADRAEAPPPAPAIAPVAICVGSQIRVMRPAASSSKLHSLIDEIVAIS